jgi:hypothetical protein
LGLPADRRWVLAALGGFDLDLKAADWPEREDVLWLVPAAWGVRRPDTFAFDAATAFTDLFACADAVIAKPGYGTFVEAAVHGVPLLYLRRPDWPEEACLVDWIHAHGRARELDHAGGPGLLAALDALWASPAPPRPEPTGTAEAASRLLRLLGRDC